MAGGGCAATNGPAADATRRGAGQPVEAFPSQRLPWFRRLAAIPGRWIVDREILLRSDRSTRCLRISRRVQIVALGLWAVLGGWMSFASTSYFEINRILDTRTAALDQAHDAYRDLLNQMANHQVAVMAITRDLETKQKNLRRLLELNESLRQDLKVTESQLKQSEAERAWVTQQSEAERKHVVQQLEAERKHVVQQLEAERTRVAQSRQAVAEKMSELEQTVRSMWGENGALERHITGLRSQLASIEAEKEEIAAQRSALSRRMTQLQADLKASQTRTAQLEGQLDQTKTDLQSTSAQRDHMYEDSQIANVKVRDLETRVSELQRLHRDVMQKLSERTRADLHEVQRIVTRTGLNLDTLLPKEGAPPRPSSRLGGQGGPFIPLFREPPPSSEATSNIDQMSSMLGHQLRRLDQIHTVLRSIPLFAPLDQFQLMSGFGARSDPFNGQPAMHYGLDMAANLRTPVLSTAPGIVVVAGWRSRYGRMVEIDHGNGLRTRYGHLYKINVRRGQKVGFRETVGLLGSSGRSTGPHVHYEVLVNGEPTDPSKFLRAGKDVFKG
jgi:murein DD-endopeptidase MepM/ murein hydrolase activator NlpD